MPSNNNDVMLLEELRSLETELHTIEARRKRQRMEMLLHPDFVEFGRSGRRYTRADSLNEFGRQTYFQRSSQGKQPVTPNDSVDS
jgi:hypothetical protein